MHSPAHPTPSLVLSIGHFLYWPAILEWCATKLERRTIVANPQDLEDDKLDRHKTFDLIVYLAIMLFFSKHLSPAQMSSSARMQGFCEKHAGLLVCMLSIMPPCMHSIMCGMQVMFMYAFQHDSMSHPNI